MDVTDTARVLTDEERFEAMRSTENLKREITRLARHLNAANHRFLVLIAELDRRKGWSGDGATQSCAHWLNWKCGLERCF
jgi:hypothetical protein